MAEYIGTPNGEDFTIVFPLSAENDFMDGREGDDYIDGYFR